MNILLLPVMVTTMLLIQILFTTVEASGQKNKISSIRATTPSPSHFSVKDGKIMDLNRKKALFFKGVGYSPYLPGETPLQGASPGDDGRYREHLALTRDMGVSQIPPAKPEA